MENQIQTKYFISIVDSGYLGHQVIGSKFQKQNTVEKYP